MFKNDLYFSREFGPGTRDSGVFRYATGHLTPIAGGPGDPATLSQTGDDGPATAAALDLPPGIAFSTAGDPFIA